jgi:hypothetical protein
MGHVGFLDAWNWFTDLHSNIPILISGGYRPGAEIDAAIGMYYDRWHLGGTKIAPLAQAIATHRWRDSGSLADSENTGYDRVLLAPGFELGKDPWRIYADVGFPIYQFVNGNQLVASEFYKLNIGYAF